MLSCRCKDVCSLDWKFVYRRFVSGVYRRFVSEVTYTSRYLHHKVRTTKKPLKACKSEQCTLEDVIWVQGQILYW